MKQTQLATVLSVSSLPLSVMVYSCHACVNLSGIHSSGFMPTLRSGSSPSPTRQWAGILHARNFLRTFGLHEIFKCVHLKFTVYGSKQTYIHTTSAYAVTLVWGLLRLAPIMYCTQPIQNLFVLAPTQAGTHTLVLVAMLYSVSTCKWTLTFSNSSGIVWTIEEKHI